MDKIEEAVNQVRRIFDDQANNLTPNEYQEFLKRVAIAAEARFFKTRQSSQTK
jgi:hypothetical protein